MLTVYPTRLLIQRQATKSIRRSISPAVGKHNSGPSMDTMIAQNSDADDKGGVGDEIGWKRDLLKLGWEGAELDWKGGLMEERQIGDVLDIRRCPYVRNYILLC
jgi:hypothetical protein